MQKSLLPACNSRMLGGETLGEFLDRDWHRQPRVFESAINPADYDIPAAILGELSSSELVESRLVDPDFEVFHGPFEIEGDEADLVPDGHMLMVQCLEQHLPLVNQMIAREFSFLPRWQIDDVMATLGPTGASCGAHFDKYDVFLVQLTGRKTWHLDAGSHTEDDLQEDRDLRLLETFTPTRTHDLGPGDVLYIPPGVGHHGICEGNSLTLSVGIRNPTTGEMLADISEFALEAHDIQRPMESRLHPPGELPAGITDALRSELDRVLDDETLVKWYGTYVTRLRVPELLETRPVPDQYSRVQVTLPTRMTVSRLQDQLLWFVNGECYELPAGANTTEIIAGLCETGSAGLPETLSPALQAAIEDLLDTGALTAEDDHAG
ncbi:MAG: cupin domain-containing protein [Proteobacteria bacterium]|nr:cupin domain-containing protein [Pseudomonadota bacterium]